MNQDFEVSPTRASGTIWLASLDCGPTTGYVAFVVALTFMCNVFLGEETRAVSLSTPLIIKEFGISASQLGFAQTIANWIGLIGWCGSLLIADGLGRRPAFLTVLLGFSITAPLIGIAGSFSQLTVLLSLAAVFRNTGTINYVVLAETAPAAIRSFILAFLNSAVVIAYMTAARAARARRVPRPRGPARCASTAKAACRSRSARG